MESLQGKTVWITGSTSGIGFEIAKAMAKKGANIVLHGLTPEEGRQTEPEIRSLTKGKVHYVAANLAHLSEIERALKDVHSQFDSIDILINNAGVQHVESIETFPRSKWDLILAVNLSAPFHLMQGVSEGMKKKGWGRVIQISSVHGIVASPYKSAYVATKHGITGLTKASALDLAEFGITVNAVCPGYTVTPLLQKQIPEQATMHQISEQEVVEKIFLKEHVIKQFVMPNDIAELVLYLCLDAAKMITGQSLVIDGGWTVR
jgi:3-hydroxybutyrate dehydrogenase